jgi:hypothetical protein
MSDLTMASIANYPLGCFVVGVILALASIARAGRRDRSLIVEKLLARHIFWSIGVCYLVNFVFHAFFGQMAAAFIGWSDSPFQFEVATASLSFSVVGFLAAWRLAAILGPGIFVLGAAVGRAYQMITAHNFAPGNADVIFYADIGLPLFGLMLLWARSDSASGSSLVRTQLPRGANL